jgi:hypothetical protein
MTLGKALCIAKDVISKYVSHNVSEFLTLVIFISQAGISHHPFVEILLLSTIRAKALGDK